MCDYSLHAQPNRLAVEGEKLILVRFPGGSLGFASRKEVEETTAHKTTEVKPGFEWSWKGIRAYFATQRAQKTCNPMTAVCLPPGARLQLDGLPVSTQRNFAVTAHETVVFTQLGCEPYTYRDAVRFDNGKEVLLQHLAEKQLATVLSLSGSSDNDRAETPSGVPFELSRI
jgi:hypothetical protein